MSYLTSQIYNIVNDSVKDALGKNAGVTKLDTTDFVSLGKQIESMDLYEGFFGALANRIVRTIYFVRSYQGRERNILRDEHEYGAFIQKVYYKMPQASENATWAIPDGSSPPQYVQASPYDVENVIDVSAKVFGGEGTWSIEFIRPKRQIKHAFTSESGMMAFIDGIYLEAENAMQMEIERLTALAVNTAIASVLDGGSARNLLGEYNLKHSDSTLTIPQALESADFLKFASKEIGRTIENMAEMSTVYSKNSYETFTDSARLVVEILSEFALASDMYLQADTFHDDLVKLPNYEKIPFWQSSGKKFAFADTSKIAIEHDDLSQDIEQSGIICFLHDIENVAAFFGHRETWEMYNPRSSVMIHGEKAEKGYAVDDNANAVVFYMADSGTVETPTGDHFTASLNTNSVVRGEEIILTVTPESGYTATVKIGDDTIAPGSDGKYHVIPADDSGFSFTVTAAETVKVKKH